MERGPPAPPFHFDYGEDDGLPNTKPSVFTSSIFDAEVSVPLLVVGVGRVPSGALKTRLALDSLAPATITTRVTKILGRQDEEDVLEEDADTASAYMLDGVAAVVLSDDKVPIEDANTWVKKLLQHIKPAKVVVLCEQPLFRYRSEEYIEDQLFLRELHSSAFAGESPVTPLTPPNIVDGLAAAILARCEFLAIPGQLLVSFRHGATSLSSAMHSLDNSAYTCFDPAFSLPEVAPLVKKSPEEAARAYQQIVKSTLSKPIEALLYM